MNIKETLFQDVYILEPAVFHDNRGFFMESYNKSMLSKLGIDMILYRITILFQKKQDHYEAYIIN